MGTIQTIHKQTSAGDRRTAFTALLAECGTGQKPQSESCLTAEELAWLVDHPDARPEQEKLFDHLASCDPCCQQWLELSRIAAMEQEKSAVTPLFTPGRLAWAGSFLAAAASVVLFLNIQQDAGMPVLEQSSTTAQRSPGSTVLSDSVDQELASPVELVPQAENMTPEENLSETDAAAQPAAPAPVPPLTSVKVPVKKEKKSFPSGQDFKNGMTNAYRPEPAVQSMGIELESMAFTRGGLLKAGSEPATAADWLAATAEACNRAVQGEYISRRFWQEQYLTGRKLLSTHQSASFSSSKQRKQVEQRLFYLQLLATGDQLLPLCETILNQPGSSESE
jgi:hypothetical protein